MGVISNIACKTIGLGGMSLAVYDAYTHGSHLSNKIAQAEEADHFEKIHAQTRSLSTESYVNSAMQHKIAELRMNNPLISAWGKTKGFCEGFIHSLGSNILPVAFSALAICTKGFMSKLGAIGAVGCGAYKILKEGFGVGKHSPIE